MHIFNSQVKNKSIYCIRNVCLKYSCNLSKLTNLSKFLFKTIYALIWSKICILNIIYFSTVSGDPFNIVKPYFPSTFKLRTIWPYTMSDVHPKIVQFHNIKWNTVKIATRSQIRLLRFVILEKLLNFFTSSSHSF